MGLSLKTLKKIEYQLNPLDNGKTFKNPQGNKVAPGQAAPSAIHQLTHNGATNFAGGLVKPLAQFPIDASQQIYNHVVAPSFNLPKFANPQANPNHALATISRKVGATGTLHQTLGSGLQTALTIAAPGVENLAEGTAARILPKVAPKILPKVISGATLGAGFNSSNAASQGQSVRDIVKAGAEGAALGGVLPVAPKLIKVTARGVKKAPAAFKAQYEAANPTLPAEVAPVAKTVVKSPAPALIKAQGAPEGKIASPVKGKAKTSMPEVNDAINTISKFYTTPSKFSGGVQDVVKQAQGKSIIGIRMANDLRNSLKNNLSEEENQQVSDILDNHPGAVEAATPKAVEAAQSLKPLQDQGFAIRKAIDPNVNKVQDYVTRLPAQTAEAASRRAASALGKIRNLSDITNLNSSFSQSRKIGKFVDSNGDAVYGDPSKLGITAHQDGTMSDANGVILKPTPVSKRELEANGAGQYEHNIARISKIYHSDTASLKIRAEALQNLKENPEAFGLTTVDKAPAGSVPITKVPELDGLYGSKADIKALEDGFGFKHAPGALGKAYDAVSNVATQAIVLNPFFHGMNQLYQTGIAAGNMPGMGTGWLKVARAVLDTSEKDIREFLDNGGHSPDYGAHRDGIISKLTGGASKVNTKTLAAIELKLRAGLYKASVDSGMKPTEAVDNIDKFLGDSKHIDPAIRRATLFAHYFKTMAGAIGSQVAHPIEQKGSILNTGLLAAITAAVSYGYQQFTGNDKAYVRVPGELGLIKEGVGSVEDAAKGNLLQAGDIVTNRVNPVGKEVAQQVFNKDLFTGNPVTDTGRVSHAVSATIAPAQTVGKVTTTKKNVPETVANQFGLYTPHAKGYQATSNPDLKSLNTPKALPGNGEASQTAYFDGLKTAQKSLQGDKKASAALSYYLAKTKDPNTGQSIQNSPSESIQNASALYANDKLRSTVKKFEQSQPSHDPMWDLPDDKLKAYQQYKEQFTGDAAKKFILSQNPWITDLQAKSEAFYNALPKTPGSKPPKPSDQTPVYPVFDAKTQGLLDQYDKLSGTEASDLINNNHEIVDAFAQVSDWTNKMRKAEGAPQLKGNIQATPEVQKIIDTYNNLPKNDGPKGGNKTRSAWINANPDAYSKMQQYYTQTSLQSLVKNAALDQFQGADANQQLLKSIYNLGQYDVGKNTDGTFALNPTSSSSSSSSSYTPYSSSKKSGYDSFIDTGKYTVKGKAPKGKVTKPHISLKKSGSKSSISSGGKIKVTRKASKV